ncbi:MAG: hypothetical protein R3B47_18350 [Bacteroidia bacterium]
MPTRLRLGANQTEGLGAGANPDVGKKAAIESLDELRNALRQNTKMVFVTAGMGGGTGTGAAPVLANMNPRGRYSHGCSVSLRFRSNLKGQSVCSRRLPAWKSFARTSIR